jgi:hypothetical protein
MLENYSKLFELPKGKPPTPLEKNDHPELDDTAYCTDNERGLYWSIIGSLQWLISLGRFDIQCATMTLAGFRTLPRAGHLQRAKRVMNYIKEKKHAAIRIRTQMPDYESIPKDNYDWANTVYGNPKEQLPKDLPVPLGKPVITTTYVDANLMHDTLSGRSVTGVLHLINKTPIEWYSKKQATVETATYGSEFVAARIATDQVIDLRMTIRYLGVPLQPESFMFGDNKSVITNATIPHSQLTKRHHCLSYHRVREAVASGFLRFHHISGEMNPADVVSKHYGHQAAWPLLKPLLFWQGDTAQLLPEKSKDEGKPDSADAEQPRTIEVSRQFIYRVNTHTVFTSSAYKAMIHYTDLTQVSRGVAGINRPYQGSGYGTGDPTTWDTDAGTEPTHLHTQASQSNPIHGVRLYERPHTTSDYVNGQILSGVTHDTKEDIRNNTNLATGNSTRSLAMEARSESFAGQLEEENYKCQALNKLDNAKESCADQKESQTKQD